MIAIAVEAIWHLGSAVENPGGWGLSVPRLTGSPFAVPDLSLLGAFTFDSFRAHRCAGGDHPGVHPWWFANFFDALGT